MAGSLMDSTHWNFQSRRLMGAALAAAMLLTAATAVAQLPFFPGAEGYGGAFTGSAPAGGWFANATIYHVTTLADSGPGSLRAGVCAEFDQ